MATRSAQAVRELAHNKLTSADILNDASIRNAMVVHAACGGSTNLLLHLPAIAFAAGLDRPSVHDWIEVNRNVPRFVDVLPNGPTNHPTVHVFLAGGVPEVMLHLRDMNQLDLSAMTVTGKPLEWSLQQWEQSERRQRLRDRLFAQDGINPEDVIIAPDEAKRRGLTSTVCFPVGNISPEGSVIKSTSIDPSVVDDDGVYRMTGSAKVFTSESDAIAAVKDRRIQPGDVLVLKARGPMGSGMEETYQITSALKYLEWGKHVAVVTDARFSGVSTGACIGHVGPEALAGGPIGKLRDGDRIRIVVDRNTLIGDVDYVGRDPNNELTREAGADELAARPEEEALRADPRLPDDTRLWAALQAVSGGIWGGCVYDPDAILKKLHG
jgi:putative YjhG/YagF family dehydratase